MSRSRNWCFTLNNPEGELPVLTGEKYVVWQLEKGENNTLHWQGFVRLTNAKSLATMKKWLPRAHFESMRGTPSQAREYCMKEDSRQDGPWERPPDSWSEEEQGKRNDLQAFQEAVRGGAKRRNLLEDHPEVMAKYPRFAKEYMELYSGNTKEPITGWVLKEWQQDIWNILSGTPDERRIYWVYDPIGGKGKTFLCNILQQEKNVFYSNGGKPTDLLYAYEGQRIVLFDFVRSYEEYVGYGAMEQLKNGNFFSPKYESVVKRFKQPHVIVFANFPIDRSKLSEDRICEINL